MIPLSDTTKISNDLFFGSEPLNLSPEKDSVYTRKTCPELSVIVPIYNDGILAAEFCSELLKVLSAYMGADNLHNRIELIFVDDGSRNDSMDHLKRIASKYEFVKIIEFSRNFGHHIAISAGFQYSTGELITHMDVDMQDPLSELPRLIQKIKDSHCDVVQGVRIARCDSWVNKITSSGFIWLFNKLSGINLPDNGAGMRVMNRKFIDAFNLYTERVRFSFGLEYWLGFKREFVEVAHSERSKGKSSYNLKRRLNLAMEAIVSFSDLPLKASIGFGCILAISGFLLGCWYILEKLLLPSVLPGFTSIIAILLFSQGAVMFMMGITGLYIGRILKEVQSRPLFVVRESYNFACGKEERQ